MDQSSAPTKKLTIGQGLVWLAFLLALGVRFFNLGSNFLSDWEASLALQAFGIVQGSHPIVSDQPGYTLLTSLLFLIFGSSEFLARFWPALLGSLVVWAPYLFRKQLGWRAVTILAFCLALEPGLVSISREAGGLSMAVTFGLLAAGFLFEGSPAWAGVCAGLALLGGPGIWFSMLPIGLTILWTLLTRKKSDSDEIEGAIPTGERIKLPARSALLWMVGTLFLGGSLFFAVPSGIGGIVTAFTNYLSGWVHPSGASILQVIVALGAYEPFAIILGLWGLIASLIARERIDIFLGRWILLAFVFMVVYPSRQVDYLVWVTIPLWGLVARQVARQIDQVPEEKLIVLSYTFLLVSLMVFTWMEFLYVTNVISDATDGRDRIIVMLIAGAMILLMILLVGWGWGIQTAASGLFASLSVFAFFYLLSAMINAGGLGRRPETELWPPSAPISQGDILVRTIKSFSDWDVVKQGKIDVQVVGLDSPSLRWALRNQLDTSFTPTIATGVKPGMIITSDQQKPSFSANYTGEGFIWQERPNWSSISIGQWAQWITVRDLPVEKTSVILWVRSDLFPGAAGTNPVQGFNNDTNQ